MFGSLDIYRQKFVLEQLLWQQMQEEPSLFFPQTFKAIAAVEECPLYAADGADEETWRIAAASKAESLRTQILA